MHLGKDFWKVLDFIALIIRIIREWSKDNNEDTPADQV